jgi:voltage-gated potassium channel
MIKNWTYNIIKEDGENNLASDIFDFLIIGIIIVNILLIIVDTFEMNETYYRWSSNIEFVSIMIFTVEYIMRLWTADLRYPKLKPHIARIKHSYSFMAIIDLVAILPFYLPFLMPIDLRVLRIFRMIRLMRIFKVNRYTSALKTIASVFIAKKSQLLSSLFIVSLLLIVSSVLMHALENRAQPEVFANAFSGLLWAVATFTTAGYGDIYPITVGGRIVAGIISVLGILMVAVPTGIISAGFIEESAKESVSEQKFCSNCGAPVR